MGRKTAECRRALIGAIVLSLPGAAAAQQFPASWTEPVEPVQIADNLYYVGTAALAAFLVTSDDGHILLDVTLDENVPLIVENIRRVGFDPADIRVLVASHAHSDHVGGLARMLEITGAELALSRADSALVGGGINFGVDLAPYTPATATRTLSHLDEIRVGNIRLVAHLTPGHTPGCTSWSGAVTIDGEALEFVSLCSLSVLRSYQLLGPDETYPGQAQDYCRSAAHLAGLSPDVFLASHAAWFRMASKAEARRAGNTRAFVDPGGYQSFVERAAGLIDEALAAREHEGGCASLLEVP